MTKVIIPQAKKKIARSHFIKLRKDISNESRFLLDTALFSNAALLPQYLDAEILLCYYPIKGEPNILPLVRHAQTIGKTIAFPISHTEDRRLSFHVLSDLSALVTGAYGIPEPPAELPELTDFDHALCLVPALAFDKKGHRLGYGGGYYDKFISKFKGITLGLAYSEFFVDTIPTEAHDAAVDIIITEKGGYFPYEERK